MFRIMYGENNTVKSRPEIMAYNIATFILKHNLIIIRNTSDNSLRRFSTPEHDPKLYRSCFPPIKTFPFGPDKFSLSNTSTETKIVWSNIPKKQRQPFRKIDQISPQVFRDQRRIGRVEFWQLLP